MSKKYYLICITLLVLTSSCGFNFPNSINTNDNLTNIELSKKNFKIVNRVSGQSTATYIFGIGGIKNKALLEKAKSQMYENANLIGSSKAIINVTTETHVTFVLPFFLRKTLIENGYVVEFTE